MLICAADCDIVIKKRIDNNVEKFLTILDIVGLLSEFKEDTVLQYDAAKLIVSVQGLVNRDFPSLYLMWQESDSFWFEYMTRADKFLHGIPVRHINNFDQFLDIYGSMIKSCGICTWDSSVPATANAATTACGVDRFLPIRFSTDKYSILSRVMSKTNAEIKLNLSGMFTGSGKIFDTDLESSGSKKCDIYLWAISRYIEKTNPRLLFYTLDATSWKEDRLYYPDLGNAFVFNHDYSIAKKAFVFDLSSYDDEKPCDDLDQPLGSDLAVMKQILRHKYEQTGGKEMITVCGFNPWQLKYTDFKNKGKHGGVEAEWRFTEILSAYNCIKDADAYGFCGLANASVFTHYPLKKQYKNPKPDTSAVYDKNKTYILFYVGDYDAASWTARHIPIWYKDEKLGKNPLMWCFNPNLSDRIPQAFDFIFENFTPNDYFEAGDSGAGYLNPRLLYEPRIHSDLPDGSRAYVEHNKKYFSRFDMHTVGFIINGNYETDFRQMKDIALFADCGAGYNRYDGKVDIADGTVFMGHTSDIAIQNTSPETAAETALTAIDRQPSNKRFHIFRTILVSPENHDKIYKALREARPGANFELVDPYTFFRFAAQAITLGDL